MKKLKKLFFILLTGIMVLGGSVACLAATSSDKNTYVSDDADEQFIKYYKENIATNDDIEKKQYVLITRASDSFYSYGQYHNWVVLFSDKPVYFISGTSNGFTRVSGSTYGTFFYRGRFDGDGNISGFALDHKWDYVTTSRNTGYSGLPSQAVYSNYDVRVVKQDVVSNDDGSTSVVFNSTNDIFFSRPKVVAEAAVEIPKLVATETKTILPVAIGGLALLIGCLVLLPKLRNFLVV